IRISLDLKDVFKTQLRAILRASAYGDIRIMYPMIISVDEFMAANAILQECKEELRRDNIPFNDSIQTGIMIETPAAVLCAEDLAKVVDFFSIGTNDLTQYLLAVDRGNQKIARLYNSFHPAVLRAIRTVIQAGHKYDKMVGMCGEFASDEKAVPILLGMGLNEFSMAASEIASTRYQIRHLNYEHCQALADEICKKSTIAEVREMLEKQ
ncbi:putative PEP-binding protein, partial [Anaerotignum sp.]